jgi:Tol biopolymer transport system component
MERRPRITRPAAPARSQPMRILISTLAALAFITSAIGVAHAEAVYVTKWKSDATHKAYRTKWKSEANCIVYRTKWKSEAKGKHNGKWYFTKWKSEADKRIYWTKWKSEAKLKVYFTKWKSEARCIR